LLRVAEVAVHMAHLLLVVVAVLVVI